MPFPLDDFSRKMIQNHFRRKKLEWTETYFINVLERSPRKHDIYWAAIALRDCGTARSIPALKAKLHYPMQDVKCTSILTVAHIAGALETLFYAEALLDPTYKEKGYAMWAIRDTADERAVDAVLKYLRENMSKIRRGLLHNGALGDGIQYLERYLASNTQVEEFFHMLQSKWASLADRSQRELAGRSGRFPAPAA